MSVFNVTIGDCYPASPPMDRYETEQFLYDLELDAPGAQYGMELVDSDFLLVLNSNFRELNRLAHRIGQMDDYQRAAITAWCGAQELCTVDEALQASYNLGSIMYMPGMNSDEELGEFALENGMLEEYNNLPDDIYEALDKAKAGARLREQEGGVFVNEGYLLVDDDFSSEPLPAEDPCAYFQVRFSDELHDSGWCDVPLSESDEGLIARVFGCENLSGLPIENRSIIPYLNGMISGADELPELNLLSEALGCMGGEDVMKYKALLEVVQPEGASEALRLAGNLDSYAIETVYSDPSAYGRRVLLTDYGLDETDILFNHVNLDTFGAEAALADGYELTRYGAVLVSDTEQVFDVAEEQSMGGMGCLT